MVSDTPVTVESINTALVTHVDWMNRPSSSWAFTGSIAGSAVTSSVLAAEGDKGRVFVDITWSDGFTEPANSWTLHANTKTYGRQEVVWDKGMLAVVVL